MTRRGASRRFIDATRASRSERQPQGRRASEASFRDLVVGLRRLGVHVALPPQPSYTMTLSLSAGASLQMFAQRDCFAACADVQQLCRAAAPARARRVPARRRRFARSRRVRNRPADGRARRTSPSGPRTCRRQRLAARRRRLASRAGEALLLEGPALSNCRPERAAQIEAVVNFVAALGEFQGAVGRRAPCGRLWRIAGGARHRSARAAAAHHSPPRPSVATLVRFASRRAQQACAAAAACPARSRRCRNDSPRRGTRRSIRSTEEDARGARARRRRARRAQSRHTPDARRRPGHPAEATRHERGGPAATPDG